ncbi:cytidylyltransferase domain-containing protein [Mesotoga sp. H07.pep.5.3]|uniref:cytidylyltransferase domain-containing protein n=1 Tax=Mesotoga sp. H07.pep.5.3 TaxID=1421003 RepID=UPI0015D4FE0F|nr:glycosyltransferase family protein [Mesotoga sp. H07.pep.5.3]
MVNKVATIIQARMGSSRLPGKIMKRIGKKELLWYSANRASKAKLVNDTIIATTVDSRDNTVFDWCKTNGFPVFRGSEKDVLDRYYNCAKEFGANIIVRLTSDNPFCDPEIVDQLVLELKKSKSDYVSNRVTKRTWPYGLDAEVFTFKALKHAWEQANKEHQREHVTPYILEHSEYFRLLEVPLDENLSNFRLSIDYPEDFEMCKVLIEGYNAHEMNWREIIDLLKKHPELVEINASRIDSKL